MVAPTNPRPKREEVDIPLAELEISPLNMRRNRTPEMVRDVAASLAARGQELPLIVRRGADGKYRVEDGGTRLQAMLMLTWPVARCVVLAADATDAEVLALQWVYNCVRHDVTLVEKATTWKRLKELLSLDNRGLAKYLGDVSEASISKGLLILESPEWLQELAATGAIGSKESYLLARMAAEPEQQKRLADEVKAGRIKSDTLERMLRKPRAAKPGRPKKLTIYRPNGVTITVTGVASSEQLPDLFADVSPQARKWAAGKYDLETISKLTRDESRGK
jgi:ParB family chromosome partitioning protein